MHGLDIRVGLQREGVWLEVHREGCGWKREKGLRWGYREKGVCGYRGVGIAIVRGWREV